MSTPNEYDGVTKNSIIKVNVSQGVIEEEKIVNINTNTQTVIEPDEGYDAIEKVTINTNIPNETTTLVAVSNGNYNPVSPYIGYNQVSVNVPNQVTSLIVNNNGIYTPVSPYIGYNSVSVNVPQIQNEYLQNKRIISNNNYLVSDLMSQPNNYDGISKNSNIIVDVPTPDITQISNYSIINNGIQTVPIPNGYDAVDSISLNVQVPTKIYIDRVVYDSTSYYLTNCTEVHNYYSNITIPSYNCFLTFCINDENIRIRVLINSTVNNKYFKPLLNSDGYGYYALYYCNSYSSTGNVTQELFFDNSNNENIIKVVDNPSNDSYSNEIFLFRNFIDFII